MLNFIAIDLQLHSAQDIQDYASLIFLGNSVDKVLPWARFIVHCITACKLLVMLCQCRSDKALINVFDSSVHTRSKGCLNMVMCLPNISEGFYGCVY